jgi:hypothetical protein
MHGVRALALTLVVGLAAVASSAAIARSGQIASDRAGTCVSAPVHYEAGPRPDLRSLPWVSAGARRNEIVGYLFYYREALSDPRVKASAGIVIYTGGELPGKVSMKILWVPRRIAPSMVILGRRLDGQGAFRQRLRRASGGVWPSIVRVPEAGCWRLTLSAGRVSARLGVLAINPTP